MKFENVMLGADPELFFRDSSGKFISSIGRVGGTKEKPRPIDKIGSAVQEDNVAVEFNIAPAKSQVEFLQNLYRPLSYLNKRAKELHLSLSIIPSAMFDRDQLDTPEAMMFGCDIDYNVWTGKPNPRPVAKGEYLFLRTCGGHEHVSWSNPTGEERKALIKALDLFEGVPSVLMDDDSRRRLLYGKAGAYRPKMYGVEYRVLSNFWIRSPNLMRWVYSQTERAMEFLRSGMKIDSDTKKLILKAINFNHIDSAKRLVDQYELTVLT